MMGLFREWEGGGACPCFPHGPLRLTAEPGNNGLIAPLLACLRIGDQKYGDTSIIDRLSLRALVGKLTWYREVAVCINVPRGTAPIPQCYYAGEIYMVQNRNVRF